MPRPVRFDPEGPLAYKVGSAARGDRLLLKFILSFFGGIFAFLTNGAVFAAAGVAAILYTYSRDLPNHEQLAQYTPPTISRIYSGEGRIIDEFAAGAADLHAPIDEIPDLVKQAFISAEDKNFYNHERL